MKLDHLLDGIDHINCYSKGATELGRWLSNFTKCELDIPPYGKFSSMEAYYYFVSTGFIHDELKGLYGFTAKKEGRNYAKVNTPDFEERMREGLRVKVASMPAKLKEEFIASNVPFEHYYVYTGKVVPVKGHDWITDELTKIRSNLRGF